MQLLGGQPPARQLHRLLCQLSITDPNSLFNCASLIKRTAGFAKQTQFSPFLVQQLRQTVKHIYHSKRQWTLSAEQRQHDGLYFWWRWHHRSSPSSSLLSVLCRLIRDLVSLVPDDEVFVPPPASVVLLPAEPSPHPEHQTIVIYCHCHRYHHSSSPPAASLAPSPGNHHHHHHHHINIIVVVIVITIGITRTNTIIIINNQSFCVFLLQQKACFQTLCITAAMHSRFGKGFRVQYTFAGC